MAKKDFSDGFSKLLGDTSSKEKKQKKTKQTSSSTSQSKKKTPAQEDVDPEVRATYIVRQSLVEKLKDISYWERAMLKEVVQEALGYYINAWEKQNGPVKPRKQKRKKGALKK